MPVPKLRFKDDNGNDFPAWEEKKLGDISNVTKLAGFEFTKYVNYSDTGKIIALRGLNIKNGKLILNDVKYIDNSDFSKLSRSKLKKGDILLTYIGTIGECALITEDDKYYLAPNVAMIRMFDTNPRYMIYFFQCDILRRELYRYTTASSQEALTMENVRKMKIFRPVFPEQKKIADFFSSFDKRIETTQKKLTTLEKLKKGFMQKIFSQQLRFKDANGNDYPAWAEKKLGDVCSKIGSGKTPKGGQKIYQDFGILLIRSQNVQDGALKLDDAVYISEKINDSMKNTEVHFNDILLNITGASIGRCCINEKNIKANVNQHVCIIRIKSQNSKFLLFELLSNLIQNQIDRVQSGGSKQGLNFQQISNFFVLLPSLPEQEKIADFLSAFDEKMDLVRKEVDTLQTIKKGLLQQMFV